MVTAFRTPAPVWMIGAAMLGLLTWGYARIIAASAYLVALLVIHLLAPRLEPAPVEGKA